MPAPSRHGADQPGAGPMMGVITVRMPWGMEQELRQRAQSMDQTPAEWARNTLARGLRRPLPRSRPRLPVPDEEVRQLVRAQQLVAAAGLVLREDLDAADDAHGTGAEAAARDQAESPRRANLRRAGLAMERASGILVGLLEARRR